MAQFSQGVLRGWKLAQVDYVSDNVDLVVVVGQARPRPVLVQQWGAIEHRREVTKPVFKQAHNAVEKLGLAISGAPNALYGLSDIISCMIRMSHMESYAGVASDTAREGEAERMRDGGEGKRIPTPQWTLGKLREVANEDAEPRCMDMLR